MLGLGSAGRRHAELLEAEGVRVLAFDPRLGDTDPRAVIERADAVVVASPSSLHAEQAALALAAGRPVLVEKPLATTVAQARALRPGPLTAGVAMNWRFHPAVLAARALLADGALGTVLQARVSFGYDLRRWRPDSDYRASYSARADLGGGIVLDAIHELDYLLWLLGPATSVIAETGHLSALELDGVEDTAAAVVRHAAGALAVVELNFHEPAYRRGFLLIGSDATASWAWGEGRVVVRDGAGGERAIAVSEDVGATYRAELRDFLDAVSEDRPPRATLADGTAALALAEALRRSAASGRRQTP